MDINIEKAKAIKLVIFDVDGVLTNGQLLYSTAGEYLKIFNVKDGLGIKLLQKIQIKTAIISCRNSDIVTTRMNELGIDFLFQGVADKRPAYESLVKQLQLSYEQISYLGDDLPDIPLIKKSGFGVAVADAHETVKVAADWITTKNGGMGAARELSDYIIKAQNRQLDILEFYS